jgi:hypothetical protein
MRFVLSRESRPDGPSTGEVSFESTEDFAAMVLSCPRLLTVGDVLAVGGWGIKQTADAASLRDTGSAQFMPELLTDPAHWHLRAQAPH